MSASFVWASICSHVFDLTLITHACHIWMQVMTIYIRIVSSSTLALLPLAEFFCIAKVCVAWMACEQMIKDAEDKISLIATTYLSRYICLETKLWSKHALQVTLCKQSQPAINGMLPVDKAFVRGAQLPYSFECIRTDLGAIWPIPPQNNGSSQSTLYHLECLPEYHTD